MMWRLLSRADSIIPDDIVERLERASDLKAEERASPSVMAPHHRGAVAEITAEARLGGNGPRRALALD
jgi:hypothetical protein